MNGEEMRELITMALNSQKQVKALTQQVKELREEKRMIVSYLYELARANGNQGIIAGLQEELPKE